MHSKLLKLFDQIRKVACRGKEKFSLCPLRPQPCRKKCRATEPEHVSLIRETTFIQNGMLKPRPGVRQDQRYLAEKDLFPLRRKRRVQVLSDFQVPLSIVGMEVVAGDPNFPREISCIQALNEREQGSRGRRRLSSPISLSSSRSTTPTLSSFIMQTHGFL